MIATFMPARVESHGFDLIWEEVFPACAGMIPCGAVAVDGKPSVPRMRGDDPRRIR